MTTTEIYPGFNINDYTQASVSFDAIAGVAILKMKPHPRPCFTLALLNDIRNFQLNIARRIKAEIKVHGESKIKYVVLASGLNRFYNLGGDLAYFSELIHQQNHEGLLQYAIISIKAGYEFAVNFGLPVTSVSLVEGNAQGGGFEAALSCNVIIAERGTVLGFPERMFNLFPGMGAYTFLSRRINKGLAERIIMSGDLYPAERLYEMGVVDILAEPGQGKKTLYNYISRHKRNHHMRRFIGFTRSNFNRVNYTELYKIAELWAESAMALHTSDLRTIQRLIRAQDRRIRDDNDTMFTTCNAPLGE